jgi:hypothetical protein
MALVSLPRAIEYPGQIHHWLSGVPALTTHVTVATGQYASWVMSAPRDMVVSHIGLTPGTVTASGILDLRIETVGTDGIPTGTLWDNPTDTTNKVTAAGQGVGGASLASNTWSLWALTGAATITKGQIFAVKFASGGSGTSVVIQRLNNNSNVNFGMPYFYNDTGSPAKAAGRPCVFALGSSETSFYNLSAAIPVSAAYATLSTFNSGSDPNAAGVRFQVPFKCRCVGLNVSPGTAVGDFNIMIQNDSNTEFGSSSTLMEGDRFSVAAAPPRNRVFFDTAVTLEKDTWYRAVIEPTSVTNCSMYYATVASADILSGMIGGSNFYYTARTSTTWNDTTTRVPLLELLIDQVDDGTGSGGGAAHIIGG